MKGMQKIKRGKGFRGLVNYCLDHDCGHVIGGNMSGATPRALAHEFSAGRQQRPDIDKPVWHNSLRLPVGDSIPDEKWQEIAVEYMQKLGFEDDHQFAIIKHSSEEGEHVHIIANRISLGGVVYLGKNENLLSTRVISMLEQKHKLAITKSVNDFEKQTATPKRKPKQGEVESALRAGIKPARMVIQNALDSALSAAANLADLTAALAKNGITVVQFIKDDEIKGLSFALDTSKFSGSQLGDSYKYPQILKKFNENKELSHDKVRTGVATTQPAGTPRHHDIPRPSVTANQENDAANQGIASGIGSAQNATRPQNESAFLTSSTSPRGAVMKFPATLGGRLYNQKSTVNSDAYDIFYTADKKPAAPVMRWDSSTQRLDLLRTPPTEQDLRTLFELARNQGLTPPYELHGSTEFQRAAMVFAIKNNITVTPMSKKVGMEHVQQSASARQTADTAGAAATAAAAVAALHDKHKYEADQIERAKALYEQQQEQRKDMKKQSMKFD